VSKIKLSSPSSRHFRKVDPRYSRSSRCSLHWHKVRRGSWW
jgi:hypothetical protein